MSDRPFWPPGSEIAAQAFDKFDTWMARWPDDLVDLDTHERAIVYGHMRAGVDIDSAKAMARVELSHEPLGEPLQRVLSDNAWDLYAR
jgi:hypothetical protein